MREDRVAELRRFGYWISAGREQAAPLVRELLEHEPAEWDSWLTGRPEARSVQLFEGLLQVAEADDPRSLPLTEFVVRYVDSLTVPPEADLALLFVRGHARRVRGLALLRANDSRAALQAYDEAAAIFRTEPVAHAELKLVLQELSRQVVARSDSVPLESLAIAGRAVAIADLLPRQGREQGVAELRAQAWKDLGVVYRYLARFSDSLAALDVADGIVQPFAGLRHPRAILQLARAGTLDEAGRHDEAMSLLSVARSEFRQIGDPRRLFLCGILEGAILQHSGRHRDAVVLYESLLEDARRLDDPDLKATLHNNAGHALVELGEFAAAGEHLGQAAALFDRLGRPLKVAGTQLARGRMLVRQGNVEEGLAQLHSARDQFLNRNLVEEAGLCGLDIVEAHLTRGAAIEAEAFARQIVREFTAAHLNARAITALQYLSEAVAARNASAATVGNVRAFIHALRRKPDAEFKVPA